MTVIGVDLDPDSLTVTIRAEFDAPPERVWQVWADPRQLERWWGPPGFPATVIDHDLIPQGRVTYFMTGSDGEHHGWWRVIAVDPPHAITFEDGFSDSDGQPDTDLPTTAVEVRLVPTPTRGTAMTITSRFASLDDMRRIIAIGQDQGMTLAVGQIDAVLASPAAR